MSNTAENPSCPYLWFLSLALFLLILLLEFLSGTGWLRKDLKQKPWEKAARAFLLESGANREEAGIVTSMTEHRWRLTARSETLQQEARAEACFAKKHIE